MRIRVDLAYALLATAVLSGHDLAFGEELLNPVLTDRFTFRVGAIYNDIDGTVTVSRAPLPTTPIDFDDLGIDEDQVNPWGGFRWRFAERWSFNLHYDRYDKDSSVIVEDEFNFDGEVYPVGVRIDTTITADAYVMDVSYSIFRQRSYEVGIGLGLHAFDLSTSIGGAIQVDDTTASFGSAQDEIIAPVPNIRLFGTYAINSRLSLSVNSGWLSAGYEDWDGRFLYLRGSADYRVSESWSIGLGFQYTDMDVEHNRDNGDFDEYEADLLGLQGYVSYSF